MSSLELDKKLLSELYSGLYSHTQETARAMGKDDTVSFKKGLWFEWEGGKQKAHDESKNVMRCAEWKDQYDKCVVNDVISGLSKASEEIIGQSCTLISSSNLCAAKNVFYELPVTPPKKHLKPSVVLYDLFKSSTGEKSDGKTFSDLSGLFDAWKERSNSYQVISYLFFLKDENEYVTVRPKTYQLNLPKLGVSRKLVQECSWANYRELNCIMKQIRDFLREKMPDENISLIDAQSFFWMLHRVNGGENRA